MGESTGREPDDAGGGDGEPAAPPDARTDEPEPEPGAGAPAGERAAVPPLLVWALAAFHAALLVAVVVGTLFFAGVAGNQLAALDTSIGVVAYCYLWGVTWWTNRRWLEALEPGLPSGRAPTTSVFTGGIAWGGTAGVLAFLPALVLAVVVVVAAGGVEGLPFLVVTGVVGLLLAAGAGVAVGGILALLDLLLLRAALAWMDGSAVGAGASARTDTP